VLSAAAAAFTFRNFSTAFPLVSIDLKMDRADALRTARELAQRNTWPPAGFDQAADFNGDQEAQNFIELEGGGKQELSRIVKEKIFALYTWRVRHSKKAIHTKRWFASRRTARRRDLRQASRPRKTGATKPVEEAQQIAEATAKRDWNIDFGRYRLIESQKM